MLREAAAAARVYVVAHVCDDVGEATVRGALEAGGLVGGAPDQVRKTRQAVMAVRQRAARWSPRPCGLRVQPGLAKAVAVFLCCHRTMLLHGALEGGRLWAVCPTRCASVAGAAVFVMPARGRMPAQPAQSYVYETLLALSVQPRCLTAPYNGVAL